jgi:TRAP-type mannitol/chloroaromatic compound transport system substrate-binding protein
LDTIYGAAEVFAKMLGQLSEGRFTVKVHAAGKLVPAFEVLDAVEQGVVEVAHSAGYYFVGKHPALAFDTAVPFGMTARQHMAWLEAGGLELLRELFAGFNVINFPGGNTGVQMGGWFRESFASLAELKGRTMRIPGMGGKVMARLGVTALAIPGGEVYQALERGRIDATEWVGPYDDYQLGFHRVARHYYYPGWWEPGPALSFYVNRAAYERLPAYYRELVDVAARQAGLHMLVSYDQKNPIALEKLLAEGVTLHAFPRDVLDAAERETRAMLADDAARDATFRKLFEHWDAFRRRSARWLGTAELSYATHAHRTE